MKRNTASLKTRHTAMLADYTKLRADHDGLQITAATLQRERDVARLDALNLQAERNVLLALTAAVTRKEIIMKVSEFHPAMPPRKKGQGRPASTYRAARREIAKARYRATKRSAK